ncbi:hypothetical protein QQ045_006725 [Rhodiola kirilowii]
MMIRTGGDDCLPWLVILIRCDMTRLGPHSDMMVRIDSDDCPPWILQISFSCIVLLPAIVVAYGGQAAFLTKFPDNVANTFYASFPASQAMISGAFAIVSRSLSLGCFPRVKVVDTSAKYTKAKLLMIACVAVTLAFNTTENISHAYAFISVEGIYLSSGLYKFTQGGYFPLALSCFLMSMMGIWHYVHKQRYMFELNNKVPCKYLMDLAENPNTNRVPGIGLLYLELVQGIPPHFSFFFSNIPSIHSILVFFLPLKHVPISKVAVAVSERFLYRRIEPREYRMFRAEEEMQFVQRAMEKGVVYLLGESEVVAEQYSSVFMKIIVNYDDSFLRRNFRQGEKFMAIPRGRLLRVGMTYEI